MAVRIGSDGALTPIELAPAVVKEIAAAQMRHATNEVAASRAFLLEYRTRRGDYVQPLHVQSDEAASLLQVGVKSLSGEEFIEVGVLMAAGGYGLHDLTNAGAQVLFYSALFFVGVVKGEAEDERYFESFEAARDWLREPGFIEVPLLLRSALFERNPSLKKVVAPDGLELLIQSGAFSNR